MPDSEKIQSVARLIVNSVDSKGKFNNPHLLNKYFFIHSFDSYMDDVINCTFEKYEEVYNFIAEYSDAFKLFGITPWDYPHSMGFKYNGKEVY